MGTDEYGWCRYDICDSWSSLVICINQLVLIMALLIAVYMHDIIWLLKGIVVISEYIQLRFRYIFLRASALCLLMYIYQYR